MLKGIINFRAQRRGRAGTQQEGPAPPEEAKGQLRGQRGCHHRRRAGRGWGSPRVSPVLRGWQKTGPGPTHTHTHTPTLLHGPGCGLLPPPRAGADSGTGRRWRSSAPAPPKSAQAVSPVRRPGDPPQRRGWTRPAGEGSGWDSVVQM